MIRQVYKTSPPANLPLLRAARIVEVGNFFAAEKNFSVILVSGDSGFEAVERQSEFVGADLLSGLVLDSGESETEDRDNSEVGLYSCLF